VEALAFAVHSVCLSHGLILCGVGEAKEEQGLCFMVSFW